MKNKSSRKLVIILAIILTIAITLYSIIVTRQFFVGTDLAQLGPQIKAFGLWAPLVVFGLIFLCIIIPPFPLPIPPIEILAGALFGFLPGVILVWLAQFSASITAYALIENVSKSFLGRILGVKYYKPYRRFIEKKGVFAVFIARATMTAPFSVSYLAGLSKVKFKGFAIATAFGILPEALLFNYAGSLVMHYLGLDFWYVFILFVVVGILPFLIWLTVKLFSK
ncbi:MAG: VTT domain-containing protein [Candidatus Microgenomates bacterium]